jgi:chitin disaccharide deacetylase
MHKNALIVHADDFGLSGKVNEGIIRAHSGGIVTSTSLMANGAAFEEAVSLARNHPTLDVGIHLTAVEEKPLLGGDVVPSLVQENGLFFPHAIQFIKNHLLGKISSDDVRKEFRAQIEKILDAGIHPSHLDSHQHIHILPGIFKITLELAEKFSIPAIRIPRERVSWSTFTNILQVKRFSQFLVLRFLSTIVKSGNIHHADYVAGFLYSGRLNKSNLITLINNLPSHSVVEIICHPGLKDPDSDYSHWNYNWQGELDALSDEEIRSMINMKGMSLISYRELIE